MILTKTAILAGLLSLGSLPVFADSSSRLLLPDAPVPKLEGPRHEMLPARPYKAKPLKHFNAVDWTLLSAHASSALFDGFSTRHFESVCPMCQEGDPLARTFLGPRPTWRGMLIWGGVEVGVVALLPKRIRRPLQVGLTVAHLQAGTGNYRRF